jgi:hypothetical protein
MPLIIIRSGPGTRASNHPPLTPLTSGNKTLYNFPGPTPPCSHHLPASPPLLWHTIASFHCAIDNTTSTLLGEPVITVLELAGDFTLEIALVTFF